MIKHIYDKSKQFVLYDNGAYNNDARTMSSSRFFSFTVEHPLNTSIASIVNSKKDNPTLKKERV